MYIKLFKSFISNKEKLVEVTPNIKIKDNESLKSLKFEQAVIYVNGFQKDENYVLKENDNCTIRYFPADGGGGGGSSNWVEEIVWNILTGFGYTTHKMVQSMINDAIAGISQMWVTNNYETNNYNYDQRSYDYSTHISNTYVQANSAIKSPDMKGCKNKSGLDQPYPLVIGKSYFVPTVLANPYITPAGDRGTKQTYHALFNLGYSNVNVSNICLGLHTLATNRSNVVNGFIPIDGDFDANKYQIQLEIRTEDEVSLFPQKVLTQEINAELMYPQGEFNYVHDGISSLYPQKIDVEFYLDGLVGKVDGKEATGTLKLKIEYSTDGGNTWHFFGQAGVGQSGCSYDSNTGETILSMMNYHSMRLVATKEFSASEVFNATNHVVELRIQRTTVHIEDNYIYDTVTLANIRTYCYDPEKSTSSSLVPQSPVCEKDRTRLTRLGFTITSDSTLYDLDEFNCIVQSLGRICTESNGYYTWTEQGVEAPTCNPASMALKILQSPMLGIYTYSDDEIDMQKFGELYKFCAEYDINDAQGNHVGLCANGVVTKAQKLSDLLAQVLSVGRAYRVYNNNKISLFIDKPIPYTTFILNNQNVLSATNTKNFDELPSGIKATFVNEDNYNQEDSMFIDYDDAPPRSSSAYTTQAKQFTFQTNVEQIKKNGLYELARMKLRPESWERKVTTEGCLAYVGCKVEIQDDTIAVGIGDGAEIKKVIFDDEENPSYITGIVTDGEFDVDNTSLEYGVKIQQASLLDGIQIVTKKVVITQAGVYKSFTFDSPISLNERVLPAEGDILSFGVFSKITYEAICIGKKPSGDGSFDLTFVPYVEGIYTADGGTLPEFISMTSAPSEYRPTPSKPSPTYEDIQKISGGSSEPPVAPRNLTATAYKDYFAIQCVHSGASLKDTIKYFEFEITKGSGSEPITVTSTSNKTEYRFVRTGTGSDGYPEQSTLENWTFRVRAVNIYGIASTWVNCENVSFIYYGTWQPVAPVFTLKDADEGGINFAWNAPNGVDNKVLFGNNTYELTLSYNGNLRKTILTDNLNAVYNFVRSGTNADGYPEKPDVQGATTSLGLYTVKIKAINESSKYAESTEQNITYANYKTWIPPTITKVAKEVVDRTIILTALYNTGSQFYGNLKTLVKISRKGNLDPVTSGSQQTFNDLLGISDDVQNNVRLFYTPNFDDSVQTSDTEDNEPHYRKNTTDAYVSMGYKFSHTLPLIGQTYRIFKDGVFTGVFTKDVADESIVPTSPIAEDLIIHYIGESSENLEEGFYYQAVATEVEPSGEENPSEEGWYELDDGSYVLSEDTTIESGKTYYTIEWVQVFSKANIVPTTYVYSLQFTNESGNVSNLMDNVEATAQCTNIADIVHSHDHYKNLYVEKLSAINANLGIISQGGMGEFKDWKNFWALSDLSAEDSGVAGGVKKGSFRVGGDDQYFEVMPDPDKDGEYIITLKAGNITLTSNADASFKQGTYIYDNIDPNKRLALTSTGIIAQQKVNGVWSNLAEVRTDDVGNMIITNGGDTPEIGVKVTGDIYHFENASTPFNAESNTNPQAVSGTGTLISTENENPLIRPSSSEKCFSGTVQKDVSQFTGNVVFFSKANLVFEGGKYIRKNGAVENDNQNAYNELMRQAKGQSTVGAYLGLTQTQIDNGIFTEE